MKFFFTSTESINKLKEVGLLHSSDESAVMELERRGQRKRVSFTKTTGKKKMKGGSARDETKTLPISKGMVYEAYKQVKRKGGTGGVDGMSLKHLEVDLSNQLYKLWNRMTSGSYYPAAVKRVSIAKPGGGQRRLGIPTVLDRVGQTVVRDYMEDRLEKIFHRHSYGYRPARSAHQALQKCRDQVTRYAWVLDLDIKGFFDNLDHDLLLKAVARHFPERWIQLYVSRWLKAPIQEEDGWQNVPERGTPQGGVISPLLANLYLHYSFDRWFSDQYDLPFERYADDIIIHCNSESQARHLLEVVSLRMKACGLELHPQKTGIVYCGKSNVQTGQGVRRKFTFLGYDFKHQRTYNKDKGKARSVFGATVGKKAKQRMLLLSKQKVKRGAVSNLPIWIRELNGQVRGWLNYYSYFSRWTLCGIMRQLNHRLTRWVMKSYKRYKYSYQGALNQLRHWCRQRPDLFVHWQWGFKP